MRLIDADELLKSLKEQRFKYDTSEDCITVEQATETCCELIPYLIVGMIEEMPTVDAEPVRHGKWIKGSETKRIKENRYGVLFDAYYCSACESEAYWDSDYGQILFHYCPNCGARMDEE